MNSLPPEILHIILGHLPFPDLCQSHTLVCKEWRDIIQQEKFMKWQKMYYKYRLGDSTAVSFLKGTCEEAGITRVSMCLQNLIKYIIDSSACTAISGCARAQASLQTHSLYSLAVNIIKESSWINEQNDLPFWGIITTICLVSSDAWSIYDLLKILTSPNSEVAYPEIAETFYCILSFFLYFTNEFKISSRWHYNLYQALQWYENYQDTNEEDGNLNVKLTNEQLKIVHHDLKSNEILKIVAFAGTGKTTTLIHFTKQNPNRRFLLLTYNRAASDDATQKFPANVKCATVHQLAYKYVGVTYKRLHSKRIGNLSVFDLIRSHAFCDRKGFKRYQREALLLETLNRFMASADERILLDHVPTKVEKVDVQTQQLTDQMLTDDQRMALMNDACSLWSMICKPNDKLLSMPFDAFLKIWQLKRPNLFKLENVDCVIVDEGQDMNNAMLDIFLGYGDGSRVIVGDPHQQIYQWRYAINALDRVTPTHTYYLTKSFRFGPEVGYMASSCLSVFKGVTKKNLIGSEIYDSLDRGEVDLTTTFDSLNGRQICFLARTNLGLFKKVIQIIEILTQLTTSPNKEKSPLRISFAGGVEKMGFDAILNLCSLRDGRGCGFLQRFGNIEEFKQYVEHVGDKEWAAKLAILQWGGSRTEEYINTIYRLNVNDMSQADIVFSTAHKSKGLEWDIVAILDDFVPNVESHADVGDEGQGEPNLLYVAVTRAKNHLIINPACYYVLLAAGDCQEKIVDTEEYLKTLQSAMCSSCRQLLPGQFEGRKASLAKLPLQVTTTTVRRKMVYDAGLLCSSCAGLPWYISCKFDCYTGRSTMQYLKNDLNHRALRFLVGPPDTQESAADAFYQERHAQMKLAARGFLPAHRMV